MCELISSGIHHICEISFSQDPRHPGDRVILVHSLVKQGTAERDGRLKKGDKLLSVNDISVVNHSLQFAVDQLVAVPTGGVARVGVNHPLPASPEINSDPTSPLGMVVESGQFFNEGQSTLRNVSVEQRVCLVVLFV